MRPQAPSSSCNGQSRSAAPVASALLAALFLACGCGEGVWPDREGQEVENIRVDTVHSLPKGGRFILRDSATAILFSGYHAGYECSRVLEMSLDSADTGSVSTYKPRTRVRLPATPDCPIDGGGRDTILTRIFSGPDTVRFANSFGAITDTAVVVRGSFSFDTIKGVPDSVTRAFRSGKWEYRDSSAVVGKEIRSDSLSSCQYLDHAEHSRPPDYKQGDTITVRIALVTLDSAEVADGCLGSHSDFFQPSPAP